jgi:hypothetical protein
MKCCIRTLLTFLFAISCPLLACVFCKDTLPQGMARGFNWSILLMLGVPTLVVAVIAGTLWRATQRRRGLPNVPHE